MAVDDRLSLIIDMLKKADRPVSGTLMATEFGVSRQIIVQDINRLRDKGHTIISTPRGYYIDRTDEVSRIFKVYHTVEDTEQELNLIVDLGAEVRDVFIFHKVYGEIHAKLGIRSRKDVKEFLASIKSGKSSPLSTATAGYHYHTIIARDQETMDMVERELKAEGFLANLTDYEPESLIASS